MQAYQDDPIQGILFNKPVTIDLTAISAAKRRSQVLKNLKSRYNLKDNYSLQSWVQKITKAPIPKPELAAVHKGRARSAEIEKLVKRLKIEG